MKQIRFIDKENDVIHGGILTADGDIICGCCGCLIPKEEIGEAHEILNIYDLWINLDEEILGDDYEKEGSLPCPHSESGECTLSPNAECTGTQNEQEECVYR